MVQQHDTSSVIYETRAADNKYYIKIIEVHYKVPCNLG